MRVVFFGTPAFAVPTLERLLGSSHEVVGVVSQPDRPRGRGQHTSPEAVAAAAVERGLPLWQPERLNDAGLNRALESLNVDLGVVAAYGRLLPERLLAVPRRGFLNVHASLLPRWRGAAPVHRAIMAGDQTTGVTIMRVVLALDAGPMLARASTAIGANETSAELEERLAVLGADLLINTVDRLSAGSVAEEPQDEQQAIYAARLERKESQIDWNRPALAVHNQIRGLQPWPLAVGKLQGKRIALLSSHVTDDRNGGLAGRIVAIDTTSFTVATSPGAVKIVQVQPEGRRAMTVRDFLNGTRVQVGDRFEQL